MERELLKFGGGVETSVVNPLVLILVIAAGLLILTLPRPKVIIPFLTAALLIPTDQILLIGTFHFPMYRLLILFGIARLLKDKTTSINRGVFVGGLNKIDIALGLCAITAAVNWVLLWQQSATVIFQLGELYSTFGSYFIFRYLIRDNHDSTRAIRIFVYLSVLLAAIMLYEQASGTNPYALLSGARSSFYAAAMQREDRFRATGSFAHPILAGTFAGVLVPLFISLWWGDRKHRGLALVGVAAATLMAATSNSSTPLLAYGAGLLGLGLWVIRKHMRLLRWTIVSALITLHLVMKAPVWHLIARIDLTGNSSSYHRYQLIDQFIRHFSDWWLIGVKDNGQWGWDMWDTANQYVATGVSGGLAPLICLIAIIVYGFKYVGRAFTKVASSRRSALFVWCLGCALFAHVVGYFGISYFDQTIISWHSLLAMISAAYCTTAATATTAARPASDAQSTFSFPTEAPSPYAIPSQPVKG